MNKMQIAIMKEKNYNIYIKKLQYEKAPVNE